MVRPALKKAKKNNMKNASGKNKKNIKLKNSSKKAAPVKKAKSMKTSARKKLKSFVGKSVNSKISKPKQKTIAKKLTSKKPAGTNLLKSKIKNAKKMLKDTTKKLVNIISKIESKQQKSNNMSRTRKTPSTNQLMEKPTIKRENREFKKMYTTSDEEYMTPQHQKHFREILINWKKQLLGEMERTVHHMQDDVTAFADPNDRATQEEEFSIELRTRDRERKLIKKIEEALSRLENRDYGYCEDCGVEIGLKRLEARPTATLCIDCKTIEEIREKSSSD